MQSNIVHANFAPDAEDRTVKVVPTPAHPAVHTPCDGVYGICPEKYEILGPIGSGGMGTVYKAKQLLLDKFMAIKMLSKCDGSEEVIMRFQQEAKAASNLAHPNLVTFRDFGVTDAGKPYIVMDFIEGRTLADRIKDDGPVEVDHGLDIFIQALCGLQHAHERSVLHRDIKPGNIMLSENDPISYVKIVDFGIAKAANSTQHLTQTGEVFGTPLYMSPEQGLGKKVDARSDLYSMGCVMYEALTGSPPFRGQSAIETIVMHQTETAPALSQKAEGRHFAPALERMVAKLLAKNPDERYQTAAEAKKALMEIKSGSGSHHAIQDKIGPWLQQFKKVRSKPAEKTVLATIESIIVKTVLIIGVCIVVFLTIICSIGIVVGNNLDKLHVTTTGIPTTVNGRRIESKSSNKHAPKAGKEPSRITVEFGDQSDK